MAKVTRKIKSVLSRGSSIVDAQPTSFFQRCLDGVAGLDHDGAPCIYNFGIIDILTRYTWKKKTAHFFKKCTIGCCHEIDTEPPVYYQPRFARYLKEKVKLASSSEIKRAIQHACAKRIQRFVRSRLLGENKAVV